MKKKLIPEIRFKGFTETWTQQQLEHYLDVSKQINIAEAFGKEDVLSVSGDYGIVNQIKFKGRSFAGASVANYSIVDTGDVVYTKSPLKANPFGIIKTNCGKPGIVSTLYAVYKPKKNVHSPFIQTYFCHDGRMNSYMHPLVNKGAKNDMKVSDENALKGYVIFPSFKEQCKLTEFFSLLDSYIANMVKKYEKLVRLKSALLQKMFPREGCAVPEVRFGEFRGKWEKTKAKTIFCDYTDKGHPELPILAASQELGMVRRDDIGVNFQHNASSETTYKRVLPGQFVIHLRSFQGGFAHSTTEGIASPAYTVFTFREADRHDDFFWKYIFSSKQFIHCLRQITYGIRDGRSINVDEFWEMEFFVPSFAEQQKIALFFQNMDKLITLHQTKIAKFKNLKTALTSKMFV